MRRREFLSAAAGAAALAAVKQAGDPGKAKVRVGQIGTAHGHAAGEPGGADERAVEDPGQHRCLLGREIRHRLADDPASSSRTRSAGRLWRTSPSTAASSG